MEDKLQRRRRRLPGQSLIRQKTYFLPSTVYCLPPTIICQLHMKLIALFTASFFLLQPLPKESMERGKKVYDLYCLSCRRSTASTTRM